MHLDLESDVLLERGIDLVGGQFSETLFEEVDFQLDIKVLLLEVINMLINFS